MKINELLKIMIMQFFVISTGIYGVLALINFLADPNITYDAIYPFQIILAGFLSTLPTAIFYSNNGFTTKSLIIRFCIHYILLNCVVLGFGALLHWYTGVTGLLFIMLTILIVYVLVILFMALQSRLEADQINKKLEENRK